MTAERLYPNGVALAAVQKEAPLECDAACARCTLRERARTVCISADGDPEGLLLVGESPGRNEDASGRPFVGDSGRLLRGMVKAHWKGPIAYDNAVRCFPGKEGLTDKAVKACRGYLLGTLQEVQPTRVIALGAYAAQSLLGRGVAPLSARGGYGWLPMGSRLVPVFLLMHPSAALRNRFVRQWFEHDLANALTCEDPDASSFWGNYTVVTDGQSATRAVQDVRAARWCAFDVETAGYMFEPGFRVLSVALCAEGEGSVYVWGEAALRARNGALRVLLDYMRSTAPKVGQNVKYDCLAMHAAFGVLPRNVVGDTRLMRKLLEPEAVADLERMAELVGLGGHKEEAEAARTEALKPVKAAFAAEARARRKAEKLGQVAQPTRLPLPPDLEDVARRCHAREDHVDKYAFALMPPDVLQRYNARDAMTTARLAEMMQARLGQDADLARTWDNLLRPASEAFAQIEAWGMAASRDNIRAFDAYLEVRIADLKRKLDGYAPNMNWNSTPQVRELLYKKLGLDCPKQTDTGADSVDREALGTLKTEHPLPAALLQYRGYCKMRSNYAGGLLAHVRTDGRVHANYNVDGARSGRLSCTDPAMQTIPAVSEDPNAPEGKMARDCFVAEQGNTLVQFDYSQLELRVAAMLSGDDRMAAIFREGVDYHQRTAELIAKTAWGIAPEDVQKQHRKAAKTVNFGLLYGMGDGTLAGHIGCTAAEAARIREAILGHFHKLAKWSQEQTQFARKYGYIPTWWDGKVARKRPLWRVADQDDDARVHAEHAAVNTPVQGTASDFCLASVVEVVRWVLTDCPPARLVLTGHDSIVLEVRKDAVDEVVWQVRRIMQGWPSGGVPLVVDVETGPAWGSLTACSEAE